MAWGLFGDKQVPEQMILLSVETLETKTYEFVKFKTWNFSLQEKFILLNVDHFVQGSLC